MPFTLGIPSRVTVLYLTAAALTKPGRPLRSRKGIRPDWSGSHLVCVLKREADWLNLLASIKRADEAGHCTRRAVLLGTDGNTVVMDTDP